MSRSTSCSHVPPSSCCCRQGRGLRRWRAVLPLAASSGGGKREYPITIPHHTHDDERAAAIASSHLYYSLLTHTTPAPCATTVQQPSRREGNTHTCHLRSWPYRLRSPNPIPPTPHTCTHTHTHTYTHHAHADTHAPHPPALTQRALALPHPPTHTSARVCSAGSSRGAARPIRPARGVAERWGLHRSGARSSVAKRQ